MTYINRNPDFIEPYELHGGYLVIDGHSLAAQLYISSKCNCAFGGDYDRYSHCVSKFFDELQKCGITPLVIFDGGREDKKMKTTYARMAEKLQSATRYTPASQSQVKFMPLSMMPVFISTLRRKGVQLARTTLEADPAIAGVAKVLGCPVLSYDSDFCIFGVSLVPINTLEPDVVKASSGGYAKRCRLFRIENLLKAFPGLDSSVLPLAAILLGNDYVKSKTFENFFSCLKLSGQNQRLYNEGQRRIHTTLRWLKNYNLNDAVAAILSKLPRNRRRKVLNIIELNVDGYLTLPSEIMLPLGLEAEYRAATQVRRERSFKFQGNIDTLESRQLWRDDRPAPCENSSSEETEDETDLTSDLSKDSREASEDFTDTWPSWFKHHQSVADFPAYFIDMIHRRMFAVPVQIEDFDCPSACEMSLKIIGVIDGLLVAGRPGSDVDLSYIVREGKKFVRRRVVTVRRTSSSIFPPLDGLRDTPMAIRKRIFNDTLDVSGKDELIESIPAGWRAYIAAIVYWIGQPGEPARNSCHLHAVLFTMMLGVIDKKIGYIRSMQALNKKFREAITETQSERKNRKCNASTRGDSLIDALEAVSENDCLHAASFFISNFMMDQQLCECPRKFNPGIVHIFSQFQSCVTYAIDLNTLLGCPYESPVISDFYNGSMLYNLYNNFKKRSDVEAYIAVTLENSPSLLRVVNLLAETVKKMIAATVVDANVGRGTKRRKKKKRTSDDVSEDKPVEEDVQQVETQPQFVDRQNPFSVLGISS